MAFDVSPTLLKRRRTKIVATVGPASHDAATLERLVAAGVDVFRLNMSHGEPDEHRAAAARIREAAAAAGQSVALLVDLCGPKIRAGRFVGGGLELATDAVVRVVVEGDPLPSGAGGSGRQPGCVVPVTYPRLTQDVARGHRLLLDDGRLELRAESVAPGGQGLLCRVVHGGLLRDAKGVNFPDSELSIAALTDKDRRDAALALELEADWIALSFVRRAEDLAELRVCLGDAGDGARILAKIEKPEALDNIDAILAAADAIMVARGDLGVEMPAERVPSIQDELVERARAVCRPVVIATQMLESMLREARPTRAEVADVAHAVGSGTDAVMLSGETAVGAHPVASVVMMDRIIRQTEAGQWHRSAFLGLTDQRADVKRVWATHDAVGRAVAQLSRDLAVRAILVVSRSGTSGVVMSAARPAAPLLVATADARTARAVGLCWGVVPLLASAAELEDPVALLREVVARIGIATPGAAALVVRGFRDDAAANVPTVSVVTV